MDDVILRAADLRVVFNSPEGLVKALDGVNLGVKRGKILGLVGESGCGKTMTALAIMGLVPRSHIQTFSGTILYRGKDLVGLENSDYRKIRGRFISMIFQDPMTALHPVFTIGEQISEGLRLHLKMTRRTAREKTIELLRLVGIPAPEIRYLQYPHELSGGMRQRVMIAMAISCDPDIILADEPTTALDVTLQAQILTLLHRLKEQLNMSMILISHDLGVIAEMADEVAVMYTGQIVEHTSTRNLFSNPLHPYTRGLFNSLPRFNDSQKGRERLTAIPGTVPPLSNLPPGCKFQTRCEFADEQCRANEPLLEDKAPRHHVRCWKAHSD